MSQDEEHLRLLSIFHYVSAGATAFFASIPIIHVVIGLAIVFSPQKLNAKEFPPALFGWMFVAVGSILVIIGWVCAGFIFAAARFLAQRKHYTYCLVIAGIQCMFAPIGTILGVFTIVVLMRDSVKQLFAANEAAPPENPGHINF